MDYVSKETVPKCCFRGLIYRKIIPHTIAIILVSAYAQGPPNGFKPRIKLTMMVRALPITIARMRPFKNFRNDRNYEAGY